MKKNSPEFMLKQIIADCGGPSKFAADLGITRQALGRWRMIPVIRLEAVEKLTGIPRRDLRPDLYEGSPVMRAVAQ